MTAIDYREEITLEEHMRRLSEKKAALPFISRPSWQTIYRALARERKRVERLLNDAETALELHSDEPDVRTFLAKLKDQVTHLSRIMTDIGENGRKMYVAAGPVRVIRPESEKKEPKP
jgi:hypothetical protein